MPDAIFLSSSQDNRIRDVYRDETRARIRRYAALDDTVYLPENAPRQGVRYIFSTWGMPDLSDEEIAEFPDLEAVFYAAGSVQYFARPFLERGVAVYSAWGANAVPVMETTVAEIILANKGFYQCSRIFKEEGKPASSAFLAHYTGNYDVSVGLLGCGMIGTLVAERLREYAVRVRVFDPFVSDEKLAALGAQRATPDEIFSECRVISNHLANNEKTQKMLRYEHFSRMQSYSTFINTARGAQLCEEDLVRALREDPTRTAVLDVTFPEPPEAGHPFYELPNVILTPHLAGSHNHEVARMGEYMADEFIHLQKGEPTRWGVSLKMLETMA